MELAAVAVENSPDIDLKLVQEQAEEEEKEQWKRDGGRKGRDGIWRRKGKIIVPKIIQHSLLKIYHGIAHTSRDRMLDLLKKC